MSSICATLHTTFSSSSISSADILAYHFVVKMSTQQQTEFLRKVTRLQRALVLNDVLEEAQRTSADILEHAQMLHSNFPEQITSEFRSSIHECANELKKQARRVWRTCVALANTSQADDPEVCRIATSVHRSMFRLYSRIPQFSVNHACRMYVRNVDLILRMSRMHEQEVCKWLRTLIESDALHSHMEELD